MLLSRVASLDELFAAPPNGLADQRRRDQVIRYGIVPPLRSVLTLSSELKGIEENLRSLSEEPELPWVINHAQHDEDVSRLLEDLRDAVFRYQVCS